MHSQEYICLQCDKLFKPEIRRREEGQAEPCCPVCGSSDVEPLPEQLKEFLEENFGEIV